MTCCISGEEGRRTQLNSSERDESKRVEYVRCGWNHSKGAAARILSEFCVECTRNVSWMHGCILGHMSTCKNMPKSTCMHAFVCLAKCTCMYMHAHIHSACNAGIHVFLWRSTKGESCMDIQYLKHIRTYVHTYDACMRATCMFLFGIEMLCTHGYCTVSFTGQRTPP
jgi:hypothetical protein